MTRHITGIAKRRSPWWLWLRRRKRNEILTYHTAGWRLTPGHAPLAPVADAVFLGNDSELALVHADPRAWSEAHPCECEAVCVCGDGEVEE